MMSKRLRKIAKGKENCWKEEKLDGEKQDELSPTLNNCPTQEQLSFLAISSISKLLLDQTYFIYWVPQAAKTLWLE